MKKSYSLYAKLSGLAVGLTLLSIVVGGVGYWGLNRALTSYHHVAEINLPATAALASMRGSQKDLIISASLLLGTSATPEDVAKSQKLFDGAAKRFEDAIAAFESLPITPSEEAEWRVTKAAWGPFKNMTQEIITLSDGATVGDERAAQRDKLGGSEYVAMQAEMLADLNKMIDHQKEESTKWVAAANSAGRQATLVSAAVVVLGTVCGMAFGLLMARSISRTLKRIADQLQSAANEVLSASSHVSSSSQTLAEGATEQAAALQETNASLHQIAASVKQTADGSRQAKNLAEETHRVAQTGRENVISMRTAIEHLLNTSNDTAAIVKTIDEIAFQTNLLALNAAVEAARAGEAGKGFAVVAEEVRNLAQRSAKSAKETAEKIQAAVESSRSVNAGSETILKAVTEIESSISNVNGRISEMATSAVAQSDAVSQIVTAIQQLDSVTQHNAATSEENAAASEELTVQGGNMAAIASQLTAIVDGRRADAGSHAETSAQS